MFQLRVPKHYSMAIGELTALSQSPIVRMRARHTEKDGTVVYTIWNERGYDAMKSCLDGYRDSIAA